MAIKNYFYEIESQKIINEITVCKFNGTTGLSSALTNHDGFFLDYDNFKTHHDCDNNNLYLIGRKKLNKINLTNGTLQNLIDFDDGGPTKISAYDHVNGNLYFLTSGYRSSAKVINVKTSKQVMNFSIQTPEKSYLILTEIVLYPEKDFAFFATCKFTSYYFKILLKSLLIHILKNLINSI